MNLYFVNTLHSSRGHKLGGLGWPSRKLPALLCSRRESFNVTRTSCDIVAIEEAGKDDTAVICVYAGRPELQIYGRSH